MFEACLEKQRELCTLFLSLASPEAKYEKIIAMGKELPAFPQHEKTSENLVPGCQSILHLSCTNDNGKIYFNADSEAMISKGLAALLIYIYNGESPEALLKCPPAFLQDIGIGQWISPSRSNGLRGLFLKMQQKAIEFLTLR